MPSRLGGGEVIADGKKTVIKEEKVPEKADQKEAKEIKKVKKAKETKS